MNYSPGQHVLVKDFHGEQFEKTVWLDKGNVVFITSERVFRMLEVGATPLWPVGVPKADVSPLKP